MKNKSRHPRFASFLMAPDRDHLKRGADQMLPAPPTRRRSTLHIPEPYNGTPAPPLPADPPIPRVPQIRAQLQYLQPSAHLPHLDQPYTAPQPFLRPGQAEINCRVFDRAATDSIAMVDDSTASVPQARDATEAAPAPAPALVKALPRRKSRAEIRRRQDAFIEAEEAHMRFGDVCHDAISAVFPSLTGNEMSDVKEALAFCIPKWMALVDPVDPAVPETGAWYHEYEYYYSYEEEEE
jgi:hypothetical protein